MLVSCLLTLAAVAWPTGAAASQPQIPLRASGLLGGGAGGETDGATTTPATTRTPVPGLSPKNGSSSTPVSASLFAELEELSRIVDIAYCVGSVAVGVRKPFECPSRCGDFPDFELVTTWNTGPMLSDSCGFIALSHPPSPKRLIVAFRGTYSLSNTIADLATIPQEYVPYPGGEPERPPAPKDGQHDSNTERRQEAKDIPPRLPPTAPAPPPLQPPSSAPRAPKCGNCSVHTGFYTSWLNTRDVVLPHVLAALEQYPDYALTLVGHSLGGAVAALAGLELVARGIPPATVTTFGEPRVGNGALAEHIDAQFDGGRVNADPAAQPADDGGRRQRHGPSYRRVTHAGDPIPLLPLDEWGYAPHGSEVFIAKHDLPPSVTDVRHCVGPRDESCIAAPDKGGFFTVPARFRLWQLFLGHRDYFWRLGMCLPSLDGWWPDITPEALEETDL